MLSFQEGSELLRELADVPVDAKQVERVAEGLGAEIAEEERRHVEPGADGPVPSTLYLGIDGTGIPMRTSELQGRTGKQADGSAKTREVKLCTVWSDESRDAEGLPVRDVGSVTDSAAIDNPVNFGTDSHLLEVNHRLLLADLLRRIDDSLHAAVLLD